MEIKIATFNIQNKYYIKNYNGIDSKGDNVEKLYSFIKENNLDIIGVQELVKPYKSRLAIRLDKMKYQMTGDYRFKRVSNYFPILKKFNETNSIITKHDIKYSKTMSLPFLPNIPRIATIAQVSIENKEYYVVNTHLDFTSLAIKKRQLNKLIDIIKKLSGNIILMGDFNITKKNKLFINFIKEMENCGFSWIDTNTTTHRSKRSAIDHVFLSNSIGKIVSIEVNNQLGRMSDHYPVIITIETD